MNLIIIGTGAAAAELTVFINDSQKMNKTNFKIKGYLDLKSSKKKFWKKYSLSSPFLGSPESYKFNSKEKYILSISDILVRNKIITFLKNKKIRLENFIHHTAIVSNTAKIGNGNIIYPYCLIGPKAKIGNFNFLNSSVAIGHDSKVGDNNIFSPNCCIAGHSEIGQSNFFGLNSAVIPSKKIGNKNKIQAGMIVDKDLKNNEVIFHRFKEKINIITK
tara:strand:+ start:537 stop:1190 length:654 start_codon:yes stop_codon:yes gene_type:complete